MTHFIRVILTAAIGITAACQPETKPNMSLGPFPKPHPELSSSLPITVKETYAGGKFIYFLEEVRFVNRVRNQFGFAFNGDETPISNAQDADRALASIAGRSGCQVSARKFVPSVSLSFTLVCNR